MTNETALVSYLPMTESMYYILLSLTKPRHGYAVMLHVAGITSGRVHVGPGTIYNSLGRLERDAMIRLAAEDDRRKTYAITPLGRHVLDAEIQRLKELHDNGIAAGKPQ